MDIKQEDLIKFWTWCGFKKVPHFEQIGLRDFR